MGLEQNTKFESFWLTEEGGFELEVKRGDVDEHAAHYKQHGVQSFNPGILHDGGHDQEHADQKKQDGNHYGNLKSRVTN